MLSVVERFTSPPSGLPVSDVVSHLALGFTDEKLALLKQYEDAGLIDVYQVNYKPPIRGLTPAGQERLANLRVGGHYDNG